MNRTILIVDDEEDIRDLLKVYFVDEGYKVIEAKDGLEGYSKLENENVDVIISDVKMPNLNGIEFSKRAKAFKPDIPIYLVTAFSEYTEKEVLAIGVEAIIFKPFDISEIVDLVDRHFK
ncbi:response regulator [Halobacteriovorax sp. HLS]|uniref:response regulator n=1 Tax=Halobacteriovorax sp. HLS TaxID=2234000 RepID=UPI000FDA1EDD|nr:response regulator [Halobacteriovorax sp. HLS]